MASIDAKKSAVSLVGPVVLVYIATENCLVIHHVSDAYIFTFAQNTVSAHHRADILPYLRAENGTARHIIVAFSDIDFSL